MSYVVVSALQMTLGIFLNRPRRSLGETLKDGDLNSQQLRTLIMSNMESIKTKIDGLARRELLSSASFVEEGLFILNDLLDKADSGDDVDGGFPTFGEFFGHVVRVKDWIRSSRNKDSRKTWNANLDFDEDSARKLNDAVAALKERSTEQFKSAMESFKNAYTTATLVFFNESLSVQDRIMAAKLRVHSRMLLYLENPASANVCKLYLKDLHELSPIVEIFRCEVEKGMLSKFNKSERHELVQSVSMINFVLFRFLNCFTKEPVNVYDWPLIENETWMYNPLIPDEKVIEELKRADIEVPNLVLFESIQTLLTNIDPQLLAINSQGDLILFQQQSTNREVCELLKISQRNDVKMFYSFPEFTLISFLAVDDADFVYVFADNVKSGKIPSGYSMYDVSVFDPRGEIRAIYKNFLLFDGSAVMVPTPREYKVALCLPDGMRKKIQGRVMDIRCEGSIRREGDIRNGKKIQKGVDIQNGETIQEEMIIQEGVNIQNEKTIQGEVTIRNEEKIQREVNIQNEKTIQGEVTIRSEEKIQGEVNIQNGKTIQGEVTIRNEEKIQGKVNIQNEKTIQKEVTIQSEEKIQGEVNIQNRETIQGEINFQNGETIKGEVTIRSEEKIQGEVNIQNGETIQGDINFQNGETIQGEINFQNGETVQRGKVHVLNGEKVQGEVNNQNGETIQGKKTFQSEERIQEEMNIHVKNPRELSIGSILVKIKKKKTTLTTITDKLQIVTVERCGYQVRVFEEDGRLVREFELHKGKRETCVGITFNSFTKELVVISRVQSGHYLSTYLPETGERRHNVRLAHIGEECQDIQLTSHCRGSMALVTKNHVLYLQ